MLNNPLFIHTKTVPHVDGLIVVVAVGKDDVTEVVLQRSHKDGQL